MLNARCLAWTLVILSALTGSSIQAAPAADESILSPMEKFFPEDSNGVFVVNIKALLTSKAFDKTYKKELEGLLSLPQVQPWLKDCGMDPIKDLDRAAIVFAPSVGQKEMMGGPTFFILQGQFDMPKLQAKLDQIIKDGMDGGIIKSTMVGEHKIYELSFAFGPSIAFAVADKNTLVATSLKDFTVEAIERGNGKKKTELKNTKFKKLLEKVDPKSVMAGVMTDETIVGGSSTVRNVGGANIVDYKAMTLADDGIKSVVASFYVDEEIRGKVSLTAQDADKAKEINKGFEQGRERGIQELEKMAQQQTEMAPLVDVMKGIKNSLENDVVTFEGKAKGEAGRALIMSWFMARSAPAVPVKPGN